MFKLDCVPKCSHNIFGDESEDSSMATHASVGTFEDGREEWTSYTERLEQYSEANDIKTAEKKRAILLSVCGAATYQVIRNLTTPGKLTDHSFEELVQLMQAHRNHPPSVTVQ